jgi:hypothetical protein
MTAAAGTSTMIPAGTGRTPRLAASSARIAFDVSQFAQCRDHRKHDADAAGTGRTQNRAELRSQDLRPIEADPHAPLAEERIVFLRDRQVSQRLVASDIKSADDEGPVGTHSSSDGLVGFELLLFGWRLDAFHEEKLGAQQADAFTAERRDLGGVLESADVGEDFDGVPSAVTAVRARVRGCLCGAVRNAPAPDECGPAPASMRSAAACPGCRRE